MQLGTLHDMKELEMCFEANEWSPFGGSNNVDGSIKGKKEESVANDDSKKGKRRKTVSLKSKFVHVLVSTAYSLFIIF